MTQPWAEWIDEECARVAAAGRWRAPRAFDTAGEDGAAGHEGTLVERGDGLRVVAFASNDYLGLTRHPAVRAAAHEAIDRYGTGSGASRLVVGDRPVHRELEEELASWRSCEAALLFPTGYATNLGVISTFGAPGTAVLSDALNHASIVDGCRLARAQTAIYRHGDADHLAALLHEAASRGDRPIVVTDTVFSMDGDLAPLDRIVELCARHGALLVLDEAHAVLGPDPALDRVDGVEVVRVGTLSKSLGALGGFAAGSRRAVELLTNRARSFIFTTAPTPADTAAALAALRVVRGPEGDALRAHLRSLVDVLAPGHPSPILPVVVGEEDAAVKASGALLGRGLLVPAIRPPTVPVGTSRLRIALSAAHSTSQVEGLARTLDELGLAPTRS